jgi:hypothetical protein
MFTYDGRITKLGPYQHRTINPNSLHNNNQQYTDIISDLATGR